MRVKNPSIYNGESDSWEEMASAQRKSFIFALCCGIVHTDKHIDKCSGCSHQLKWEYKTPASAEYTIERYLNKWKRKKEMKNG